MRAPRLPGRRGRKDRRRRVLRFLSAVTRDNSDDHVHGGERRRRTVLEGRLRRERNPRRGRVLRVLQPGGAAATPPPPRNGARAAAPADLVLSVLGGPGPPGERRV